MIEQEARLAKKILEKCDSNMEDMDKLARYLTCDTAPIDTAGVREQLEEPDIPEDEDEKEETEEITED